MSYGFPKDSGQPSRPKGGGGMMFLLIIGFIGFMIFSRMGAGPNPPADNGGGGISVDDIGSTTPRDEYREREDIARGSRSAGKEMPTTGKTGAANGWAMEDVATKPDRANNDFQPTKSKTQNGDWAIEDVNSSPKSGGDFQFSKKGDAPKQSGDWEMKEVTTKENKSSGKTTNGDWSLEEVDKKKK